jgi:hypothetical protein
MRKEKKEPTPKKYFMLLMGDFSTPKHEKILLNLLNQLEPVITSPFLKYQKGDDFLLGHFETFENKKDLTEFFDIVFGSTIKNYFLFVNNRNNIISLQPDIMNYLMDLETEDNNSNEEMYEDDDDEDFININDIMSELDTESTPKSVLEHILKNSKFNRDGYKEPTLDELLDKGINNLTNKEKELLYDYSKRI